VGVEITYSSTTSSDLVVLTPAPGGPAEAAGVKAGDIIEQIDGVPARGLSLYEAGDLLQGEAGSQVEVVVKSNGGGRRAVSLTRQKVVVNPVNFQLCSGVSSAVLPRGE
jgi:carboxyl-terminal processing protease